MFSSLDRIDSVLKDNTHVQTDHRTAEEIEQVVIYVAQERPPDFLRRAIASAGGRPIIACAGSVVPSLLA